MDFGGCLRPVAQLAATRAVGAAATRCRAMPEPGAGSWPRQRANPPIIALPAYAKARGKFRDNTLTGGRCHLVVDVSGPPVA